MSACLYGSQKKPDSPSSFTIDSGAICFVLGLDNALCPLLDKIPSLVGKPWKAILEEVALSGLGLIVNLATGQIDTNAFCTSPPPPLPTEINYIDVYDFIASYVPPFSLIASGDGLLKKITQFYLYNKWFNLCECKRKPPLPDPQNPSPVPPFSPSCNTSGAYDAIINQIIDNINALNATGAGVRYNYTYLNQATGFPVSISEIDYLIGISNIAGLPEEELLEQTEIEPEEELPQVSNIGCMEITIQGGFVRNFSTFYRVRNNDTGNITEFYYGYSMRSVRTFSYDESQCCPPEPPPDTKFPPPPQNCRPVPPRRYCELFPDDPLCVNVSPDNGSGDPTLIEVDDYTCEQLAFKKGVSWNL